MNKEIKERYKNLCDYLMDQCYYYYNLDSPIISDSAYDRLFNDLKKMERDHPELINIDSPTQRVGCPLDYKPTGAIWNE